MGYRYDVSYPFFELAKRHGIDYGDVLAAAEFLGSSGPGSLMTSFIPPEAVHEIMELVKLPVYARGGRTDICESKSCGSSARWNEPLVCIGMGPGCAVVDRGAGR